MEAAPARKERRRLEKSGLGRGGAGEPPDEAARGHAYEDGRGGSSSDGGGDARLDRSGGSRTHRRAAGNVPAPPDIDPAPPAREQHGRRWSSAADLLRARGIGSAGVCARTPPAGDLRAPSHGRQLGRRRSSSARQEAARRAASAVQGPRRAASQRGGRAPTWAPAFDRLHAGTLLDEPASSGTSPLMALRGGPAAWRPLRIVLRGSSAVGASSARDALAPGFDGARSEGREPAFFPVSRLAAKRARGGICGERAHSNGSPHVSGCARSSRGEPAHRMACPGAAHLASTSASAPAPRDVSPLPAKRARSA